MLRVFFIFRIFPAGLTGGLGVMFFRDIEQVEAVVRYRSDAVVLHGDRPGQGVVVPEQASAVEAVEQVVGELQHPPGQPVL